MFDTFRQRYLPLILLLASAATLAFGIVRLFNLRFEQGDVYPQYSSLRADPLGTMALYESLGGLPGFTVERDLSTSNLLPQGGSTTYFHLAAPHLSLEVLPESTFREIERFASTGGRLVITMFPVGVGPSLPDDAPRDPSPPKVPAYLQRWGVHTDIVDLEPVGKVYKSEAVENVTDLPIPQTLLWHSGIVFSDLNSEWKPIYMRGDDPVMIQRTFGRGTVVIATDTYFVSNEAMLLDRHSDLLAFLAGPNRKVVFDETHLGITENPGVATLMRRYRLHWTGVSLLLLAILFVWKMSVPLVPPPKAAESSYVGGKDASTAIINLLRRSIPPSAVLKTCFTEWKKSAEQTGLFSAARMKQAEASFKSEATAAGKQQDPIAAYNAISRILQKRTQ